jgi:predicted lysophospholipase L1 biosynthesis ABC-type transport system permease subunit
MWIVASSGVHPRESGIASTSQQLGVATGLAILVGVINHSASHPLHDVLPQELNSGLRNAFYTAAGIAILAAALVSVSPAGRRSTQTAQCPTSADRPAS